MKNRIAFIVSAVIFITNIITAQTVIGKYAGEFMAIGVGGRPLGMGGAFVAIANDATAGYYNPSGLASIDYPEVALMHDERYGGLVSYNYGSVAIPYNKDWSFGVSTMWLCVTGIPDTRDALYDANGDGILDINTDRLDYSKITTFNDNDWAFYFTASKREFDNLYFGANIKFIRRTFGDIASATGVGFDVSAMYMPLDNWSLGVNIQDVTTTLVAWSTGRNELITPTIKVGTAYVVDLGWAKLLPAVDLDIRFENREFASEFHVGPVSCDAHVGFEFSYKDLVAVRAGYNDVKQFTIGAGIKLPKLNIDYSFARFSGSSDDNLPDTHRISLTVNLEEPKFMRSGS
jgi:hypothetical protein